MDITALPLPLSCTVNMGYVPIIMNKETTFERYNNMVRIQTGLPPLPRDSTISLAVDYIGVSSSIPVDVTKVEVRVDETANNFFDKTMIFNTETEVNDESHKGETLTK